MEFVSKIPTQINTILSPTASPLSLTDSVIRYLPSLGQSVTIVEQ